MVKTFIEYGATVWDPYQRYNSVKVAMVQRRVTRFVKGRYTRYSNVSDSLDELGWPSLSQRRQGARLIQFYKYINGLAQVPYDGVLIETYKGPINMKLRQIVHTTQDVWRQYNHPHVSKQFILQATPWFRSREVIHHVIAHYV